MARAMTLVLPPLDSVAINNEFISFTQHNLFYNDHF